VTDALRLRARREVHSRAALRAFDGALVLGVVAKLEILARGRRAHIVLVMAPEAAEESRFANVRVR
jgi:hypothetical protein